MALELPKLEHMQHVQSYLQYVGVKHGRGKGGGMSLLLKASKAAHYKL